MTLLNVDINSSNIDKLFIDFNNCPFLFLNDSVIFDEALDIMEKLNSAEDNIHIISSDKTYSKVGDQSNNEIIKEPNDEFCKANEKSSNGNIHETVIGALAENFIEAVIGPDATILNEVVVESVEIIGDRGIKKSDRKEVTVAVLNKEINSSESSKVLDIESIKIIKNKPKGRPRGKVLSPIGLPIVKINNSIGNIVVNAFIELDSGDQVEVILGWISKFSDINNILNKTKKNYN